MIDSYIETTGFVYVPVKFMCLQNKNVSTGIRIVVKSMVKNLRIIEMLEVEII